jgi:two-component system nitrogen regulation sensor histidine kinase NtrY
VEPCERVADGDQTVRLRTRLFVLVAAVVATTVAAVTLLIASNTRSAFVALDEHRTAALVGEFRREFTRESEESVRRLERLAGSDEFRRMALKIGAARADYASYAGEAAPLAAAYGLDLLDIVAEDGTIISSAHWPARFGYRSSWPIGPQSGDKAMHAFPQIVETPDGMAVAMTATRRLMTGGPDVILIGGRMLDRHFLASLELPPGMRVLLYHNVQPEISGANVIGASGTVGHADQLAPLIARVRESKRETRETIEWPEGAEAIHGIPLTGRDGQVVGALLVGSSRSELAALVRRIRWTGLVVAALGIAIGFALSYYVAMRITKPVERLEAAAHEVAAGNWDVTCGRDWGAGYSI